MIFNIHFTNFNLKLAIEILFCIFFGSKNIGSENEVGLITNIDNNILDCYFNKDWLNRYRERGKNYIFDFTELWMNDQIEGTTAFKIKANIYLVKISAGENKAKLLSINDEEQPNTWAIFDINLNTNEKKIILVSNINSVKVSSNNFPGIFKEKKNITSIKVICSNCSGCTNLKNMFYGCKYLKFLKLGKINTSNVTSMFCLFAHCSSLITLDLSSFNTSNVTDMHGMFSYCVLLKNLNLENFDTTKVTDMGYMFNECNKLTKLNLSNFDTNKVTNMDSIFNKCSDLETIQTKKKVIDKFKSDEILTGNVNFDDLTDDEAYNFTIKDKCITKKEEVKKEGGKEKGGEKKEENDKKKRRYKTKKKL